MDGPPSANDHAHPTSPEQPSVVVRILASKETAWQKGDTAEVNTLARETFSATDLEYISVFVAESPVEEVENAAAFTLQRGGSTKDPVSVLRIPYKLLDEAGVELLPSPTDGTTGVAPVDARHCDLRGSAEAYRNLTHALLEMQYEGHDLVRVIKGNVLSRVYGCFAKLPDSQVTEQARASAVRYATSSKGK